MMIISARLKVRQDRKTPIYAYKAMIYSIRDHVEKRQEHISFTLLLAVHCILVLNVYFRPMLAS